jgi:hypothetical protein
MYMLLIDGTLQQGKNNEFLDAWSKHILTLLKKQDGFVEKSCCSNKAKGRAASASPFGILRNSASGITGRCFLKQKTSCSTCWMAHPRYAALRLSLRKPLGLLLAKLRRRLPSGNEFLLRAG